jgi:hypothetical protein
VSLRAAGKLNYLKITFSLLLAAYGFVCAKRVPEGSFLDGVNLICHEAGHLLFSYFGEVLHVVGGTLGQLLVPAGFAVYFANQQQLFSASVAVFWVGQNMLGISVYAKDAAAMELPLVSVGGGDSIHDWNYLLLKLNLLAWDQVIGNIIYGCGVLMMSAGIVACLWFSYERFFPLEGPVRGEATRKAGTP